MAVAAFRSTTKRNCSVGSRDDSSSQSKPSTAHKRGHRRSKSVSDTSPRYCSDSGLGGDGRYGPADGGIRARHSWSRQLSSDSESEAEGYGQPRRYQRTSLDFSSLRRDIARSDKCRNCCGLRRSSSQLDLSTSQAGVVCRHGERRPDSEQHKDSREVQVEEKTIRAVHAQMKIKQQSRAPDPLESDPPSGEPDAISLYNAMRAEVRKAVADLRIELEQSVGKEPLSPGAASSGETSPGSVQTEVFQAVAEVRREFAAKLDQSEKRAQELWAQLAIEEKRCLDLVKFVKEMLPTSGSQHVKRGPLERQMLRRCPDKQWVSKTLDEDAKRYFEECVSISGLDAEGQDASSSGKQEIRIRSPGRTFRSSSSSPRSDRKLPEASVRGHDMETDSISMVRSPSELSLSDSQDGLVLPWLDWETEVDSGPKQCRNQNIHKDARSGPHARSWDSNQVATTSESTMMEFRGFSAGIEAELSAMAIADKPSRFVGDSTGRLSLVSPGSLSDASPGSFQRRWHRWKHGSKAEEYVVQRIRFRHRISTGRLHLCGGKRL